MTSEPHDAPAPPILVVDDERSTLKGIQRTLWSEGLTEVEICDDARRVPQLLAEREFVLLLLDLSMPHRGGEDLLREVARTHPDLPVIVVTAEHDAATAVRCMKLGAVDYLLKPVDAPTLVAAVRRALDQSALRFENARLREGFFEASLREPDTFREIKTRDPAMLRLFAYVEAIARGSGPVLIEGETGTGKELVARALHRASGRSGPLVAVNVAGLDDAVFSDTLFGHEPGAYTGAEGKREGMAAAAGAGTLLLDEIGDLSEASQVKLLRLIQEREYLPLGSDAPVPLRARIVTATHRDPQRLRPDLYYRLRSYRVRIPPLRARLGDLPLLVDEFLTRAARDLGRSKPAVPEELWVHLSNHRYPGNLRELEALVFDAVARHGRGVMPLELFQLQPEPAGAEVAGDVDEVRFPFPMPSLRRVTELAVDEALARVEGNKSAAARMLGVSRPTIARLLERQGRDAGPE